MLSILVLAACTGASDPAADALSPGVDGEVIFLRDAVVLPGLALSSRQVQGRVLPGERALMQRLWKPGERIEIGGLSGIAPRRAECLAVWHGGLGDVSRLIAMGGSAPDTALAFSPGQAQYLAVGSYLGEVIVFDGWTGEPLARRTLSESLIRAVAWAQDGETLYVTEQSPDAMLRALDPATLKDRWTVRLADLVGSSTPPEGEDIYGIYALPAGHGLAVLPGGGVVVAATHGWGLPDGTRRNQAQLLRLSAQGEIEARWPDAPAEVTLLHPRVDAEARHIVVAVGHSSDLPAPETLPVGGVQLLSLPDLQPVAQASAEPLAPWFTKARVWEGLDLSTTHDTMLMGFNDGRVQLRGLDGALRAEHDGGQPVLAGDVPIHAGVGWARLNGAQPIFATSSTRIPWGAASADLRPPSTHPSENTVTALTAQGQVAWSWSGAFELQGMTLSPDGDELVVGAGARPSDDRRDLFGALVFDLGPGDAGGSARLRTTCSTAGPVFFKQALAADGRVAVSEYPTLGADGAVVGEYRVTVLR